MRTAATPSPVLRAMSRVSSPRLARRAAIGAAAGLIAGTELPATLGIGPIALVLGAGVGVGYRLAFSLPRRAYVDGLMSGAALGVPLWVLFSVVVFPLSAAGAPAWTAAGMRALVPHLVAWAVFGAALGLLAQALTDGAERVLGPEPRPQPAPEPSPHRVLVLGGGFAGFTVAKELERRLGPDRSVAVTLVSETNALLFTPMMAEVAGSSLEPAHISTPLRGALRRSKIVRGSVQSIDLAARRVAVASDRPVELAYDQIVLALGSVTNVFGLEGVLRHASGFKSLRDAIRIRADVIDVFERAAVEPDAARRKELLTFVVAGAGFAGVELAGAINDFARGMVADFPSLGPGDVTVTLVHPGDRILPELSLELARYAQERMAARGVVFRLGERVADARPGAFVLASGEELRGRTLIWTAGTTPHPLLRTLGVALTKRGAVVVDSNLSVPGHAGLWAAGDCAAVSDARTGAPSPPTAQFALREGRVLAANVLAALRGRPARRFHFESLGALCVIGHQTACAELRVPFTHRCMRFSGLFAWFLWRSIYLLKLPGLERKVRVVADWTLELFFPRDVVQTFEATEADARRP